MGLSTRSSVVQPLPTVLDEPIEPTSEVVEARLFEDRLARAARDGGYLVLIVGPGAYTVARRQIAKRFPVRDVDGDEILLRHMKDVSAAAGAKWDFVVQKDAEPDGSPDARNLRLLVARAMPQVERELLGISGTVVLSNPGLLARYDQLGLLRRIADHVGARGAGGTALRGLWVLVPQTGPGDMPRLGDHPIPVVTKAEKARIPRSWIANVHRSGSGDATPDACTRSGVVAAPSGPQRSRG